MPLIYFTVTNDITYDQRMMRICNSLSDAGYNIVIVGRTGQNNNVPANKNYSERRLKCIFSSGKLFYAEYNIRLILFLLFKRMDGICAVDLDTIIPCYIISRLKKIPRIYDAHELFCEMKEIVSRPKIYNIWKWIERRTVPYFKYGYTVNQPIADEFFLMYGCRYEVIRSVSVYSQPPDKGVREKIILYQGAVNEGRSFETVIPAMKHVNSTLLICGDGNYMEKAKALVKENQLENKISFAGMIEPIKLRDITQSAYIGLTLFEKDALSNYYSLANRFFDYIHAGTPQLCVDYPVYRGINKEFNIAVLIDDLSSENIAKELNSLLDDEIKWKQLHVNCAAAAKALNWQTEEKKLLKFYSRIFG